MDGLVGTWLREPSANVVFVNPPFSQMKLWAAKAAAEAEIGVRMVVVAKAAFCTGWFKVLLAASRGVVLVAPERIAYMKPDEGEGIANSPTFETVLFPINVSPAAFIWQAPSWRVFRMDAPTSSGEPAKLVPT